MADHRSRTRAAPAGSTATFVLPLLFAAALALFASTPAPALDASAQAQARNLGQMFAELALDPRESNFLLQSGQISELAYRERLRRDQAELPRLRQALARLSSEQQALARQQAAATYNQGFAVLQRRVAQWRQEGQPRGPQRAGAAVPPPPPPPPPVPYTSPRQSSGFERLLVLLLIGA